MCRWPRASSSLGSAPGSSANVAEVPAARYAAALADRTTTRTVGRTTCPAVAVGTPLSRALPNRQRCPNRDPAGAVIYVRRTRECARVAWVITSEPSDRWTLGAGQKCRRDRGTLPIEVNEVARFSATTRPSPTRYPGQSG